MPQFQFIARDKGGNDVAGNVTAAHAAQAAEQVRKMGYTPVSILRAADAPASAPPRGPQAASGDSASPAISVVPPVSQASQEGGQESTMAMPAAFVAGYGARRAPIDLTQPVTTFAADPDAAGISVMGRPAGQELTDRMERLEPWERGNTPATAVAGGDLNAAEATVVVPPLNATQAMSPAAEMAERARRNEEAIVRELAAAREKPLDQRIRETFVYPILSGVVVKDLAPFYRQFSALINAGLSLSQALSALEANTNNRKLKEIAHEGQVRVAAGGKFSDVMASYPWVFQPLQIALVRAAEQGGMLDQALLQIADYVEGELELRRLISRETIYPKIVLFVALMILGYGGFTGGTMAIVDLVLTGSLARYFMNTIGFALLCLIPILAVVALFRLSLFNVNGVRERYDALKMKIPVIGGLARLFAVAKFSRTFAALYRGGFGMGTALEIAGEASGNGVIRAAAKDAVHTAEHGGLVSDALLRTGEFPSLAISMFRTGETSGGLDQMLDKIADFYEAEGKAKAHMAAIIFAVIVFLIVALLVAQAIFTQYGAMAVRENTVPE